MFNCLKIFKVLICDFSIKIFRNRNCHTYEALITYFFKLKVITHTFPSK